MKKLTIVFLFSILLISCKKDITTEHTTKSKVTKKDTIAAAYKVMEEESNAEEFALSSQDGLEGVKNETIIPDTLLKPPVIINTQTKKLIFKNINPVVQKEYYDEDEITYANLGYSKKINKHLLFSQYYEGEGYFLIDHTTAKIDTINGFPDFSPDTKKMISYYVSPYNEGEHLLSAEVEIYNCTAKGLVPLHRKTYDYIPCTIRWKDNKTILIRALSADDFYNTRTDTVAETNNYFYKKITLK